MNVVEFYVILFVVFVVAPDIVVVVACVVFLHFVDEDDHSTCFLFYVVAVAVSADTLETIFRLYLHQAIGPALWMYDDKDAAAGYESTNLDAAAVADYENPYC